MLSRNPAEAAADLNWAHPWRSLPEILGRRRRSLQRWRMWITSFSPPARPAEATARERVIKATDYQGVVDTLGAARQAGFQGRRLTSNSIGIAMPSAAGMLINLLQEEHALGAPGASKTIFAPAAWTTPSSAWASCSIGLAGSTRSSGRTPCRWRCGTGSPRADVAEAFVEAMEHPRASRGDVRDSIVWGNMARQESWIFLLDRLKPDPR